MIDTSIRSIIHGFSWFCDCLVWETLAHTHEGSTSPPASRCLGDRNLNSYERKKSWPEDPDKSKERDGERTRYITHDKDRCRRRRRRRTMKNKEWEEMERSAAGGKLCRRRRDIRGGWGRAQWHGTYVVPETFATVRKRSNDGREEYSDGHETTVRGLLVTAHLCLPHKHCYYKPYEHILISNIYFYMCIFQKQKRNLHMYMR